MVTRSPARDSYILLPNTKYVVLPKRDGLYFSIVQGEEWIRNIWREGIKRKERELLIPFLQPSILEPSPCSGPLPPVWSTSGSLLDHK